MNVLLKETVKLVKLDLNWNLMVLLHSVFKREIVNWKDVWNVAKIISLVITVKKGII